MSLVTVTMTTAPNPCATYRNWFVADVTWTGRPVSEAWLTYRDHNENEVEAFLTRTLEGMGYFASEIEFLHNY